MISLIGTRLSRLVPPHHNATGSTFSSNSPPHPFLARHRLHLFAFALLISLHILLTPAHAQAPTAVASAASVFLDGRKLWVQGGVHTTPSPTTSSPVNQLVEVDLSTTWPSDQSLAQVLSPPSVGGSPGGPAGAGHVAGLTRDGTEMIVFTRDSSIMRYNIQRGRWTMDLTTSSVMQHYRSIAASGESSPCINQAATDPSTGIMYLPASCGGTPIGEGGGNVTMVTYNPATQQLSAVAQPTILASCIGAGVVWVTTTNSMVVFGGNGACGNLAYEYSPTENAWQPLPSKGTPPSQRWRHCMLTAQGGRYVVVFGGRAASSIPQPTSLSDLYLLDTQSMTWTKASDGELSTQRELVPCAAAGNLFVAWGGNQGDTIAQRNNTLVFNLGTRQWQSTFVSPSGLTDGTQSPGGEEPHQDQQHAITPLSIGLIAGGSILALLSACLLMFRQWRHRQIRDKMDEDSVARAILRAETLVNSDVPRLGPSSFSSSSSDTRFRRHKDNDSENGAADVLKDLSAGLTRDATICGGAERQGTGVQDNRERQQQRQQGPQSKLVPGDTSSGRDPQALVAARPWRLDSHHHGYRSLNDHEGDDSDWNDPRGPQAIVEDDAQEWLALKAHLQQQQQRVNDPQFFPESKSMPLFITDTLPNYLTDEEGGDRKSAGDASARTDAATTTDSFAMTTAATMAPIPTLEISSPSYALPDMPSMTTAMPNRIGPTGTTEAYTGGSRLGPMNKTYSTSDIVATTVISTPPSLKKNPPGVPPRPTLSYLSLTLSGFSGSRNIKRVSYPPPPPLTRYSSMTSLLGTDRGSVGSSGYSSDSSGVGGIGRGYTISSLTASPPSYFSGASNISSPPTTGVSISSPPPFSPAPGILLSPSTRTHTLSTNSEPRRTRSSSGEFVTLYGLHGSQSELWLPRDPPRNPHWTPSDVTRAQVPP